MVLGANKQFMGQQRCLDVVEISSHKAWRLLQEVQMKVPVWRFYILLCSHQPIKKKSRWRKQLFCLIILLYPESGSQWCIVLQSGNLWGLFNPSVETLTFWLLKHFNKFLFAINLHELHHSDLLYAATALPPKNYYKTTIKVLQMY